MTIRACPSCKVEFNTKIDKYATVWRTMDNGLFVYFVCILCSNKPEFTDLDVTKNYQED